MYHDELSDGITFAPTGIDPRLMAEMHADHCDGIRCELEPTEEELDAMATAAKPEPAYEVLGHVRPEHAAAFHAYTAQAGVIAGFLEVLIDGVVIIASRQPVTRQDVKDLAKIVREFRPPTDETRVSVAGRYYRAEARLAGGRWEFAGKFGDENDAARAASVKLQSLKMGRDGKRVA
jgi:hypothetical protein